MKKCAEIILYSLLIAVFLCCGNNTKKNNEKNSSLDSLTRLLEAKKKDLK